MPPLIRACPLVILAACQTVPPQAADSSRADAAPIVGLYDVRDLVVSEAPPTSRALAPETTAIERPVQRPLRVPGDALAASARTVMKGSPGWDETCRIDFVDGVLVVLGPAAAHDVLAAFLAGARAVDDDAHPAAVPADAVPEEQPTRSTDWHARLSSSDRAVLVLQRETLAGPSRFRVLHPDVFAPLLGDAAPVAIRPLTVSTDLQGWAIADGERCRVEFHTLKDAAGGCLVSFGSAGSGDRCWMTMSHAHWRALCRAVLDAPWEDPNVLASRYGVDVE